MADEAKVGGMRRWVAGGAAVAVGVAAAFRWRGGGGTASGPRTGRVTAAVEGPVVVFLIGIRVNRVWDVRAWLPPFTAMGPMLAELGRNPGLGFLGGRSYFGGRGAVVIQYWRSFEDLDRFARDRDLPHLPAWRRFNRASRPSGSVGVWHETYLVPAGGQETIYVNMPAWGLAAATGSGVPLHGRRETAAGRLGRETEPAVPSGDVERAGS